ncbi:MAG: choice-of-anchor J domain-containing protein [Bacteroidota bacterium]
MLFVQVGVGQVVNRIYDHSMLINPVARTNAAAATLPCAGTEIFSEDFQSGIPGTWTVIDGDGMVPDSQMGLQQGWQTRVDYRDATDTAAVSPSWYNPVGQSDDWLITPLISVGSNSCLSWSAYSQDQFFPEAYEVRIATTNDTSAFLADTAYVTIDAENGDPTTRSATLAPWAGQDVYIAFRQTSDDKFVLVLDDVRVANINENDIGVLAVTHGTHDPGDTLPFTLEVANYGSNSVTEFEVFWSVDGGTPQRMAIDSIEIGLNETISFTHDSLFASDTVDLFYDVCAWTEMPNGTTDEDINNDTSCVKMPVGTPVFAAPLAEFDADLSVFPNPFDGTFNLIVDGLRSSESAEIRLYDMQGRLMYSVTRRLYNQLPVQVAPDALPAGNYLLRIVTERGQVASRLLIRAAE